jgi:hypothetical protein
MARLPIWKLLTRYAVAWAYLAAVVTAEIVYASLSPHDRSGLLRWASTNVVNLRHDPVGSLVASAFFPAKSAAVWPALVALAMFGANRVLGNWRTALVCAAGQVIGTLVSEGILGYRVAHGLLPGADRYVIDVGPSYVVVSVITVAILYGSWLARAAAAADLAILVFVGQIFSGLGGLEVAPVGHLTAIAVAAVLGSFLLWRRRARSLGQCLPGAAAHRPGPAPPGPAAAGRVGHRAETPHEKADRPVPQERSGDR